MKNKKRFSTTDKTTRSLPASLKELDSIATFKSKLQTFMFARTFDLRDQSMNESYGL